MLSRLLESFTGCYTARIFSKRRATHCDHGQQFAIQEVGKSAPSWRIGHACEYVVHARQPTCIFFLVIVFSALLPVVGQRRAIVRFRQEEPDPVQKNATGLPPRFKKAAYRSL
jgi:hypothetical protein